MTRKEGQVTWNKRKKVSDFQNKTGTWQDKTKTEQNRDITEVIQQSGTQQEQGQVISICTWLTIWANHVAHNSISHVTMQI